MTIADDIRRVRFQVADDVVNTLVCHHLWRIRPTGETLIEADRIADFGFQIFKRLLDFAGTLITRYVERNALFTR